MQVDRPLAYLTRRIGHLRGSGLMILPLRRWCCNHYRTSDNRWVVIKDYRDGLLLKVDRAAHIGGTIYWRGAYSRPEIEYLERHVSLSDVFVDAGANMGAFTVAIAARVPEGRVLAFEPQAKVRQALRQNVALNQLFNVDIFDFGLAEVEERVDFYTTEISLGLNVFNEGLYTRYTNIARTAPAGSAWLRPFDEVVREQSLPHVDWIKVDIEGGELPMLRGAAESLAAWRPRLLVEINESMFQSAGYTTTDLLEFLRRFEYKAFSINRKSALVPCDPLSLKNRVKNILFEAER